MSNCSAYWNFLFTARIPRCPAYTHPRVVRCPQAPVLGRPYDYVANYFSA